MSMPAYRSVSTRGVSASASMCELLDGYKCNANDSSWVVLFLFWHPGSAASLTHDRFEIGVPAAVRFVR